MEPTENTQPLRFIHRDLSWLAFNERVLNEAFDPHTPLLERLKFIAIAANNLDEFFMVRVAGLKRLVDSGYNKKDAFGWYPLELLHAIDTHSAGLMQKAYELHAKLLTKELPDNKITIVGFEQLSPEKKKFAQRYFETSLFPIITPMAIDQGHPFPILPSKTTAFAVSLTRYDKPYLAIIPVPKNVPRFLRLPSEADETALILIDEIIRKNMEDFFRGYKISGSFMFRVIRDSELSTDEDYAQDLLKAIESEVKKRPKAKIVRLEIEKDAAPELLEALCLGLEFPRAESVIMDGTLDLSCLFQLIEQANKPQLMYQVYVPRKIAYENIFDKIKEGDFITHLPFESFYPTLDLLKQAASDKDVLGIKITLYRASEDSKIIQTLKEAARNKKQVTVLVEIKARFDEEKNILWAKDLAEAGCHVIYGMPGMKIHSKMAMVVRKEEGKIRRYIHLSTGNYNEKTAHLYTDISYFTANDDFARDISDVFNVITGYSMPGRWRRVVSGPNDLRQYFFELVDKEIEYHNKYKNGQIIAKMNSLEDTKMAEKLYEASQAGVKIRLIVRGICCLIPGVAGMSENIKVKSIVGRFLEHSRIYTFNNNADPRVFLASADWMTRNFDRRIELLFEIYGDGLKEDLKKMLSVYWKDMAKSSYLMPDGTYARPKEESNPPNAQDHLMNHYAQ